MSVIGEEYLRTKERIIAQQASAIAELSTPVLQIRDRLLLMPLVGLLDTQRARMMTEQLLQAIRATGDNSVVRNNLGAYYNKVNRPADALPHLREAARIRPNDPVIQDAVRTGTVPGFFLAFQVLTTIIFFTNDVPAAVIR